MDITTHPTRPCGHKTARLLTTITVVIPRNPRLLTLHSPQPLICANQAPVRSNQACPSQAWQACNTDPARACILRIRRLGSTCLRVLLVEHRDHSHGLASTRHLLSGGHNPSSRSEALLFPAPLLELLTESS